MVLLGGVSSSSLLLSSIELSDTQVYEPYIRARLGTASHFCEVVVLKLRPVPIAQRLLTLPEKVAADVKKADLSHNRYCCWASF